VAISSEPLAYQNPVDSPFQTEPATASVAEPVIPPPPVEAPFQTPRPAFVPAAATPPVAEPAAEPELPAAAGDTDRVDDLLRQFRERYGRGSL
jgi:2-oxoglutarate dehydrogenase E2 component (dihydrolipoamide succinyltransferase)